MRGTFRWSPPFFLLLQMHGAFPMAAPYYLDTLIFVTQEFSILYKKNTLKRDVVISNLNGQLGPGAASGSRPLRFPQFTRYSFPSRIGKCNSIDVYKNRLVFSVELMGPCDGTPSTTTKLLNGIILKAVRLRSFKGMEAKCRKGFNGRNYGRSRRSDDICANGRKRI